MNFFLSSFQFVWMQLRWRKKSMRKAFQMSSNTWWTKDRKEDKKENPFILCPFIFYFFLSIQCGSHFFRIDFVDFFVFFFAMDFHSECIWLCKHKNLYKKKISFSLFSGRWYVEIIHLLFIWRCIYCLNRRNVDIRWIHHFFFFLQIQKRDNKMKISIWLKKKMKVWFLIKSSGFSSLPLSLSPSLCLHWYQYFSSLRLRIINFGKKLIDFWAFFSKILF